MIVSRRPLPNSAKRRSRNSSITPPLRGSRRSRAEWRRLMRRGANAAPASGSAVRRGRGSKSAAYAAGAAQNSHDPGLPPGATRDRSYAALKGWLAGDVSSDDPRQPPHTRLSRNPRHCRCTGFQMIISGRPLPNSAKRRSRNSSITPPLRGSRRSRAEWRRLMRRGANAAPASGSAVRRGRGSKSAAYAAGAAQHSHDPGLPPGATRGRSYAAR